MLPVSSIHVDGVRGRRGGAVLTEVLGVVVAAVAQEHSGGHRSSPLLTQIHPQDHVAAGFLRVFFR